MNPVNLTFLPALIMLLIIFLNDKNEKKCVNAAVKRKNGDNEMKELAKRFIGKDVYINLLPSATVDGILKEVVDNSVIIEKDGKDNIVNLDYVVRLREYPTNKKGKRKQIVADW